MPLLAAAEVALGGTLRRAIVCEQLPCRVGRHAVHVLLGIAQGVRECDLPPDTALLFFAAFFGAGSIEKSPDAFPPAAFGSSATPVAAGPARSKKSAGSCLSARDGG